MALRKRQNRGFTILEILIVVIIVAVLASLALPRMGSMIERARATEALSILASVRLAMERCYVSKRDYNQCIPLPPTNAFTGLGLNDPSDTTNSHFDYGISTSVNGYSVVAARNTHELLGDRGTGSITMCPRSIPVISFGGSGSILILCVDDISIDILGTGFYSTYGAGI